MMTYYVYILQSSKNGQFYIGQTQHPEQRLIEQNSGKSKFTAKNSPWNIVWFCNLESRSEAFKLEQKLKGLKSRTRLIKYMTENPFVSGPENLQISNLLDFRASS